MKCREWVSELYVQLPVKGGLVGHSPLLHMLRLSSSSDFRIAERLADEGWHEQILSHIKEYLRGITAVEGVWHGHS